MALSRSRSSARARRTAARIIRPLLAAGALALLAAPSALADLWSPESGGSSNADAIDTVYWIIMVVAIIIFVLVEGLLLYSVFKFRASKGAVAEQIRGNTRMEITWTVGAAVILVVLAAVTFWKLDDIRNPTESIAQGVEPASTPMTADGKLNICVDAFQYGWRFTYQTDCTNKHKQNLDDGYSSAQPEEGAQLYSYGEMVVPAGVTVTLKITSLDVNHAWWIPKLGGKHDAMRGYFSETWFQIPEKFGEKSGGTAFYGQCAELCGRNHANMTAQVRALSVSEFNAWARRQKADIAAGNADIPRLARKLDAIR